MEGMFGAPLFIASNAFYARDELWISPNSQDIIEIPDEPKERAIYTSRSRLADLQKTQFFCREHPWVPFVPINADYSGWGLDRLNDKHPNIVRVARGHTQVGYQLAPHLMQGWEELEIYLTIITGVFTTFSTHPHTKVTVPLPPSSSGYRATHSSYEAARFQCVLAREKFEILLAFIAYLTTNIEAWSTPYKLCIEKGVPQTLIASILTSDIGAHSMRTRRAGVIRPILPDLDPPTVVFYLAGGVPVWYSWGSAEQKFINDLPGEEDWKDKKGNQKSRMSLYVPFDHSVRRAKQALLEQAKAEAPASTAPTEKSAAATKPALLVESNRPWDQFFKAREARYVVFGPNGQSRERTI